MLQRLLILCVGGAHNTRAARRLIKASQQAAHRGKVQIAVAPLQQGKRRKIVAFKLLHQVNIKTLRITRNTKGAIVHVPPCTPCNLPDFSGGEVAKLKAIKLAG